MKRRGKDRRVLLAGIGGVVAGSFFTGGRAHAGVLNPPPGPVTPTGRSLTEIEPRTPVSSLAGTSNTLHHITQGGSYKLTGHLNVSPGQVALRISTPDPVSIDLAGFAIQGGGGGGGILVDAPAPGCAYVEVFDGYLRDLDGDAIDGGTARVLECYDLHIDNVSRGIVVNGSLVVEACLIERCASDGIQWNRFPSASSVFIVDDTECRACGGHGLSVRGNWSTGGATLSVTDFDALGNVGDGIHFDVQNSGGPGTAGGQLNGRIQAVRATINSGRGFVMQAAVAESVVVQCEDVICTGNAIGMDLSHVSADLIDCVTSSNLGDGLRLESTVGAIDACAATHNGGDGLHLQGACRMSVSDAAAHANGGAGIHLDLGVVLTTLQDNDATGNATGIRCQDRQNLLLRNTAVGNGLDYDLPPTMAVVIVSQSQLQTDNNPHANYSS